MVKIGKIEIKRSSPTANQLKKIELKNQAKLNKQNYNLGKKQTKKDYKVNTAKERASVKKTRAASLAASYQAKQATDTVNTAIKQDNETKRKLAEMNNELSKQDLELRASDRQAERDLEKYRIDKGVKTKDSDLINGGMENTHLGGSGSGSTTSDPSYKDRDKDNTPGYNIGLV